MRSLRLHGSLLVSIFLLAGAPALPAQSKVWQDLGSGSNGQFGVPQLTATTPAIGRHLTMTLTAVPSNAPVLFLLGLSRVDVPLFGGTLVPNPEFYFAAQAGPMPPVAQYRLRIPPSCGIDTPIYVQALVLDGAAASGFALSNALGARLVDHAPSDFNGDGFSDVAAGIPGEDSTVSDSGAVAIRYGGNALPQALLRQGADINGTLGETEEDGDRFGEVLAIGDFNGDGYDDLAVGIPREDAENAGVIDSGAVQVIYGSSQGLQGGNAGPNDDVLRQGLGGVADQREAFDWFGKSLAAADFNGDGCDDLAIGAPYEDDGAVNQGLVHVLFGSPSGLTTTGQRTFTDPDGVASDARFGWILAAGDFDADGQFDLVVGNPYKDVGANTDAGSATILHPGNIFLAHQTLQQTGGSLGLDGASETFDLFAFALAVGDFDNNGVDDLALGVPFEDFGGGAISAAGAVNVVYGAAGIGLVSAGNALWSQDSTGIVDDAELSDRFGYSLAAGDFDADGAFDLAVGVPREVLGVANLRSGAVHLLYGASGTGIGAAGNVLWHQNLAGSANPGSHDDQFGFALTVIDHDGDCAADLLVGVPGEDVGAASDAGGVHLFFGGAAGLSMVGNVFWDQGPLAGTPNSGDRLGASLAGAPDQVPL